MKQMLGVFALAFLLSGFAQAADLPSTEDDPMADLACGTVIGGMKSEVRAAAPDDAWSYRFGASGGGLVVWQTPGPFPTVKFAIQEPNGKWRARAMQSGAGLQGGFASPSGAMALFSMHSVEGPGTSFVVISRANGGEDTRCSEVAFPNALNNPDYKGEFLVLESYQGKANGEGVLVARTSAEDGSTAAKFYSYATHNGGKTWDEAVGSVTLPPLVTGDYEALTKGVDKTLLSVMPDTF